MISPVDHPARWSLYFPDKPAITAIDEHYTLTYKQLDQYVQRTALYLASTLGLPRGSRVAILAYNHSFFFELLFACLRSGLVLAPLNYRLAPQELEQLLRLDEPDVIFVDDEHAPLIHSLPWANTHQTIRISSYVENPPECEGSTQLLTGTAMEEPALHLFTSGTTGLPKAAVIPARQLFWNAVNTQLAFQLGSQDSTVLYTPLFHTGAINVLAMPLLQVGGQVFIHKSFDAMQVIDTIGTSGITTVFGVPTTLQMLVEEPTFSHNALRTVRLCLCGGAPLSLSLIRAWEEQGIVLTQGFGMTEVGPNCFFLPPTHTLLKAGSVGKPIHYCEARIMHDGVEAAIGEVGELWLSGPHICAGYFRNESATQAARHKEWFCTGDLAKRDEEGFYYIAGRQKDMFISGGENVYPAEVEVALNCHEQVAECAVVKVPHPKWGEVGCAFIVARNGFGQAEELKNHLRMRLAGYKIPKQFIFKSHLPRNESGKIVKHPLQLEAESYAR